MMFDRESLTVITDLTEKDIRFVVATILNGPSTGALTTGEVLAVIVYDMLKQLGYQTEHACSILKRFNIELYALGKTYEGADFKKPLKMTTLQLLDNQFALLSDKPNAIFNFTTLAQVERIPLPVLSVAIVLPKLYQRALMSLSSLRCRRSQEESRQDQQTAYEGVPEHIDQ